MKNSLILLGIGFLLSACTHSLHISHVSDFAPTYAELSKGKLVQARAEQFVIMGFVTNTNYVNEAYVKLMSTCPGSIQGITTQYATDHGFFSWTNSVEMQGLCVRR
jgi:hypothetical protein